MTYVTTKCPHCGTPIKVFSNQKTSHGCPFKVCNTCGKTYLDPNCYEQALRPYKKSSRASYTVSAFFVALLITTLPSAFIAYFSDLGYAKSGIISGIIFLILFMMLYRSGHSNYESNEERILREWQESDKRLQNPEYARAIKEAGFKVPSQYLKQ